MAEKAHLALMAEANEIARRQFFRRANQGPPARAVEALDQRRLDLRFGVAADAAPRELCGDHFGIVHYQLVTGLNPLRQIRNDAVAQTAARLPDQHPPRIAPAP